MSRRSALSEKSSKKTRGAKNQYTQSWQGFVLWLAKKIGERVQKMPRQNAMAWATRLGKLACRVAHKKRQIAASNLRLARFPNPNAGEAVGLLPDQNSGTVFVPFFGVPCGTFATPAAYALRTGAALIPTYCVRKPDDTYKFIALSPISVVSTGDRDADIIRIAHETNRVLESIVCDYPDQWLWLHNRWKSAFEKRTMGGQRKPTRLPAKTKKRRKRGTKRHESDGSYCHR